MIKSLFEIGPVFTGKKPGDQVTVVCGIKKQLNNEEGFKRINQLDVFEIKKDLMQTLIELGIDKDEIVVDDKTPSFITLVFQVQFRLKMVNIYLHILVRSIQE